MTYEELLHKRDIILKNSTKHRLITKKKGDPHTIHVCAICGQPLTTYAPRSNRYIPLKRYYTYQFYDNTFTGALCYDPGLCYQYIMRKEIENGGTN